MPGAHVDGTEAVLKSRFGIAAQGIAAAALATVVYFAFLQPEDTGPLSGIDVENGLEVEQPPETTTANVKPRRRPRPSRTPTVPPGLATTLPGLAPSVTTVPPTTDTPTGSQYSGAAARILGAVGREQP